MAGTDAFMLWHFHMKLKQVAGGGREPEQEGGPAYDESLECLGH